MLVRTGPDAALAALPGFVVLGKLHQTVAAGHRAGSRCIGERLTAATDKAVKIKLQADLISSYQFVP